MNRIDRVVCAGTPVLGLVGEFGPDQERALADALRDAFGSTGGRVLLDLRRTVHLHYRLAGLLVGAAQGRGRLGLVAPTPYVNQILRLAGSLEHEIAEYPDLDQAVGGEAA